MRQELDFATNKPLISSDIDKAIGERVRFRRQVLGWSQDELARLCNISPQQIHKYEKGRSGLRPHRLVRFADVLGVPVSWFFKGLESNTKMPADIVAILANPRIAELVQGFQAIEDDDVRHGILEMIRGINRSKSITAETGARPAKSA